MNVLNGLKNGVEGFFVARGEKPLEPAHERLMQITLVGTVNMTNSLIAHPSREAVDLTNLRPLTTRNITATELAAMAATEQSTVLRGVLGVSPEDPFNERANQLSSRGSDMVMDTTVEATPPEQPMIEQEELRPAA